MNISLTLALRAAATLLILAVAIYFYTHSQLLIKTIVVAHILLILSIFSDKHSHRISIISIGLCIAVPIGAWREYSIGSLGLELLFFNIIIFTFLAYVAYLTIKNT